MSAVDRRENCSGASCRSGLVKHPELRRTGGLSEFAKQGTARLAVHGHAGAGEVCRDCHLPQKLKGELACSAPAVFDSRPTILSGMADFGSNEDLCWAYVKPGEPVVMTWRHEDSHLLEYVPGDFPRLDPEWLMVILGIQPLNAQDFQIQKPPAGSRDLWLVSIEESASGQPLRRVIEVDTVRGFAREHALVDHNGHDLVRAQLSQLSNLRWSCHSAHSEDQLPTAKDGTHIKLQRHRSKLPGCGCTLDAAWRRSPCTVDLGDYVRRMHGDIPPKRRVRDQSLADVQPNKTMLDGTPQRNQKVVRRSGFRCCGIH